MNEKKCQYCKEPIPTGKRMDSKFCSNSCKAKHWEEYSKDNPKKIIEEPPKQKHGLEGLRGIISHLAVNKDVSDVKQTSITPVATLVETAAYKQAIEEKQKAEHYINRATEILHKCNTQIEQLENYVSYEKPNPAFFKKSRAYSLDMELAENHKTSLFDELIQATKSQTDREREKRILELRNIKSGIEQHVEKGKRILAQVEENLKNIPRYEKVRVNKNTALLNILQGIKNKKMQEEQNETVVHDEKIPEPVQVNRNVPVTTNSSIISSKELREMDYKCLNFTGKWRDFLGQPAVVFHLAVHGKPGEGKSTFCIQMANYLAETFGNVVYISGEEGFSKTLRDKVINNNITSPHLFFSDCNSYEKIKEQIENKFHFIFMDSLDTLKIDATKLRELKELYPDSAFITISQSTKDGKMRGSQEIIHDSDITLKVENGIAVTTKNRFKERGMEFEVFRSQVKENGKMVEKMRNVI